MSCLKFPKTNILRRLLLMLRRFGLFCQSSSSLAAHWNLGLRGVQQWERSHCVNKAGCICSPPAHACREDSTAIRDVSVQFNAGDLYLLPTTLAAQAGICCPTSCTLLAERIPGAQRPHCLPHPFASCKGSKTCPDFWRLHGLLNPSAISDLVFATHRLQAFLSGNQGNQSSGFWQPIPL